MTFEVKHANGHVTRCKVVEHWETDAGYLVVKIEVENDAFYGSQRFTGGQNFYQPEVWKSILDAIGGIL